MIEKKILELFNRFFDIGGRAATKKDSGLDRGKSSQGPTEVFSGGPFLSLLDPLLLLSRFLPFLSVKFH